MTYYFKVINVSEAQGGPDDAADDANRQPDPTDAAYPPANAGKGHSSEDADGLGGFRGLRSGLIIEALALGLVWGVWYCAGLVAAWWRAR